MIQIPKLTEEEKSKVLEYAYSIADCLNERDKTFMFATELRQIFRAAYIREHGTR